MSTANLIRARPANYVEIPGRPQPSASPGMIPITATSGLLLEAPKRKKSLYEEEAEKTTQHIHRHLRILRLCDAITMSTNNSEQMAHRKRQANRGFWTYVTTEVGRYIAYLIKTWTVSINKVLFGGSVHPAEVMPVFIFASVSSTILLFLLMYCIWIRMPRGFLPARLKKEGDKHDTTMFERISHRQVNAAKAALSVPIKLSPCNGEMRVFDLDIAKLCCQLSALMYQHDSNHSVNFLEGQELNLPKIKKRDRLRTYFSKHNPFTLDANNGYAPVKNVSSGRTGGDPEKMLAEMLGGDPNDALERARKLEADFAQSEFMDSQIISFCKNFGIEYEPVSQLNSASASYCAIFWDPLANWVVLAFKGTATEDFAEWITDLDYTMVHGGSYLKNFGKIHGGFSDKLFPRDVKDLGGRRPIDTIASAVKTVVEGLAGHSPENQVNIYFTGHSLGTAIASLAYARAISRKNLLGPNAVIRDTYLFATPIICDVQSVHAFNFTMFKSPQGPRTMWRISNRNDLVATGLPEGGDRPVPANPNSSFTFAHLGTEIRLQDGIGKPCFASGNHVTQGTKVQIQSAFDDYDLYCQWKDGRQAGDWGVDEEGLPESDPLLDYPIIGSVLAHGIGNYWDALSKVSNGDAVWVDD